MEKPMIWKSIESIPSGDKNHWGQILVGFQGEFGWYSYVTYSNGVNTVKLAEYPPPTHWTEIIPPPSETGLCGHP